MRRRRRRHPNATSNPDPDPNPDPNPNPNQAAEGVTLRGGRHHPTLCFTPAELGFVNAGAAAALGLEIGAEIAVVQP